jgi:heme/copper-type cytochrome/quinol oxidase subunit 2
MWGNTILESVFSGNYMFGFITNKSNNMLHLTHWQYWFWFWFTWYLGLYYIIFLNFIIKRNLKVSPKIFTSFRSHGKWGDFLVCFVPLSWCLNILTNSNFILRLVEWQSESSVFSLRVRGKQWYWVYKIDILNLYNLKNVSKNIGWSSWINFNSSNYLIYSDLLRLQEKYDKQLVYWGKQNSINATSVLLSTNNTNNTSFYESPAYLDLLDLIKKAKADKNHFFNEQLKLWDLQKHIPLPKSINKTNITSKLISNPTLVSNDLNFFKSSSNTFFSPNNDTKIKWYSGYNKNFLRLNESNNIINHQISKNYNKFLENSFFIVKQKRFNFKEIPTSKIFSGKNKLPTNIQTQSFFKFLHQDFLKSYVFTKRLLRTSKLLVLPTNVNISVITNSFDVIHSWFIPGLGLKLDCVPGRSTHHTLHIINPGFYYGQCAEICGRYHHHMPIRVCALTYPHFIFWWNNKGVFQYLQKKEHNLLRLS